MLQSLHHKHYLFTPLDNAPAVTSEMPPVIPLSQTTISHPFWPTGRLSDSPLVSHPHVPHFKTSGISQLFVDQNLLRFDALRYKLNTTARTSSNYSSVTCINMIRLQRRSTKELARTHFAVNGSLNSNPQMEILQENRTTPKKFKPTATKNTLPLNCFNMRN